MKTPYVIAAAIMLMGAVAATAFAAPSWIRYEAQVGMTNGIVGVGILLLLRGGLLSLGQGLYYLAGAYSAAFAGRFLLVSDALMLLSIGLSVGGLLSALVGLVLIRYRGIFFAMLSLALTMIAYGVASKVEIFGGTDGVNIRAPTFWGARLKSAEFSLAIFWLTTGAAGLAALSAGLLLRSSYGKMVDAVRENELRLEFLGGSTRWTLLSIQIYAGALAGLAGTLTAITALHVDPDFAYWTTSGEFVFIVVLGGVLHVMAPFLSAFFLETARMIATSAFPDYWQFVIGAMMLATVVFFPNGLWTVAAGVRRQLPALRREPNGAEPETRGLSGPGAT